MPANKQTPNAQERLMNIISLFVSYTESSLLEQPRERRFHHPADFSKSATMVGIALRDHRHNPQATQGFADLFLSIVCSICVNRFGAFARAALRTFNRFNRMNQRHRHFRVVDVGPRVLDSQRRTVTVHNQMTFRAIFASIRGIRPCFLPPKMARTEQLSIAAADQSTASAWPNSSSKACQTFFQTPATCQSRKRRQQVIPDPAPSSLGRYSQGMPVRSTNRIPVSAFRLGTGGRPPLGFGFGGGKNGWMRSHSSSVSSGLAIAMSSMTAVSSMTCDLNRPKRGSIRRFC